MTKTPAILITSDIAFDQSPCDLVPPIEHGVTGIHKAGTSSLLADVMERNGFEFMGHLIAHAHNLDNQLINDLAIQIEQCNK